MDDAWDTLKRGNSPSRQTLPFEISAGQYQGKEKPDFEKSG
jgi:hypothetical protein